MIGHAGVKIPPDCGLIGVPGGGTISVPVVAVPPV